MTPPTTWPFPRWVLRRGRWVMVRTKPEPRPAYPVGAKPAPF